MGKLEVADKMFLLHCVVQREAADTWEADIIAERLSVRRIIVGCILAMNDRPTDRPTSINYTDFICWFTRFKVQSAIWLQS